MNFKIVSLTLLVSLACMSALAMEPARSETNEPIITITDSDNKRSWPVTSRILEQSKTLVEMYQDTNDKILNLPHAITPETINLLLPLWHIHTDKSLFIKNIDSLTPHALALIINAANFLAIDELYETILKTLASRHSSEHVERLFLILPHLDRDSYQKLKDRYKIFK